jgi:hypothetical protein
MKFCILAATLSAAAATPSPPPSAPDFGFTTEIELPPCSTSLCTATAIATCDALQAPCAAFKPGSGCSCNADAVGQSRRLAESNDRKLSTAAECEQFANKLGKPFATQTKSNGAPAGCVQYDDTGRIIWVETCTPGPGQNCNTDKCHGCKTCTLSGCGVQATTAVTWTLKFSSTEEAVIARAAKNVAATVGTDAYWEAVADEIESGGAELTKAVAAAMKAQTGVEPSAEEVATFSFEDFAKTIKSSKVTKVATYTPTAAPPTGAAYQVGGMQYIASLLVAVATCSLM